ncbi:hypothetical protein HK107_04865 [Parvularcula sp. ZS-1/3]|uniref:PEP-CTERM sorting domain-containing protein n=1 Tax=Parvularcula mediterranea TaxID=2732508 RepID=A0A7Y3RKB4_9PROT|nr:hypothetical protein [Parvularcula mediterranea]NNU15647.1 hypothetical protein [Parvularcula mediterranea]
MRSLLTGLACAGMLATTGHAAVFNTYEGDQAGFLAALGGAPLTLQDFSAFNNGDDLLGAQILPDLFAGTSGSQLTVFGSNKSMFGQSRNDEVFSYSLVSELGYTALGFDIRSFDPDTPGPIEVVIGFADGMSTSLDLFPDNAVEGDPYFFGILASSPIVRLVLFEGPETDGDCCEEVSLDDFIAAQAQIPVPGAALLFLSALGAASVRSRLRKA